MTPAHRARHAPVQGASALVLLLAGLATVGARAQDLDEYLLAPQPGEEAAPEELRAFRAFQMRRNVRARELATNLVKEQPDSYVGHFVLGLVHHYAEANFPRALYHEEQALARFEAAHGPRPTPPAPWQWHARLLREIAFTHGDLEHHEEKIRYLVRYNDLYEPDLIAEQAWPLMKLGRYDAARSVADQALSLDVREQTMIALNALCAVEFEAGNDGVSYDACRRALEYGRAQSDGPSVVDLTNYAEAARSLFRFEEAERIGLEATEAEVSWYGNPWLELAELYTREGRYSEALGSLRRIPDYRSKRPPHVRDSDINERRRGLAAFLIVAGRSEKALEITDRAMLAPDRSGHTSRDPAQDRAVVALLHRRALRMEATRLAEEAAARPFWQNGGRTLMRAWLQVRAWLSGREAARHLAEEERLVGTFRVGTAASGIMPPWLAGELVDVLGSSVVRRAVRLAQARDERAGAGAYYAAFLAEAAVASATESTDAEEAVRLAQTALTELSPAEALLRARMHSIIAESSTRTDHEGVVAAFDRALQLDPGVFRRREVAIPVRIAAASDEVSQAVADALRDSPRFRELDAGLEVRIDAAGVSGSVCLLGVGASVLSCHEGERRPDEDGETFARSMADGFHRVAFAPRVDLSQADVSSLDGSNRVSRDPLEELLEGDLGETEPRLDVDLTD